MLYEYAVEPQAIGSDWQTFRYLFEKFGFDRGRLISKFPKYWIREVYRAAEGLPDVQRKRIEVALNQAKKNKVVRCGRPYNPALGGWLDNALAQQAVEPFRAIIAGTRRAGQDAVLVADEVDELHPLMISPHTWQVPRVGSALAEAIGPMLRSARILLFVDRFFDIREKRYQETLEACLDIVHSSGANKVRCEIHFCDHDSRPSTDMIERDAHRWLRGVIPNRMSIALYAWKEKTGGEDFHARYLLTDVGGINVDAGFSAEKDRQKRPTRVARPRFRSGQAQGLRTRFDCLRSRRASSSSRSGRNGQESLMMLESKDGDHAVWDSKSSYPGARQIISLFSPGK